MIRLAVAVTDVEEASECITHAMGDVSQSIAEVTIISIARVPWLWSFALQTGAISSREVADEAARRATQVAVAAIQALPASVCASYIVCSGWRDPAMRTHLIEWRHDQLIVAKRGIGTRGIRAKAALHGSGVLVRSSQPHRRTALSSVSGRPHELEVIDNHQTGRAGWPLPIDHGGPGDYRPSRRPG